MAIREEVQYREGSQVFIAYVDGAGKEHKMTLPTEKGALEPTLKLLRAAGRGAQVVREWNNDKRSRVGVDIGTEMAIPGAPSLTKG